MRKAVAAVFLVLGFLLSLFGTISLVKAEILSVNIQQTSETTFVYQPVEITVTLSGGAPPYTYQWYTQLWTTWKPGMPYNLPPLGSLIAFPGATSSIFKFVESTPGTYDISCEVTDSVNNSQGLGPMPLYVYVLPFPGSSPATAPSQTFSAPEPPTVTILSPIKNSCYSDSVALNFILQTSGEFPNPYDASSNASWGVQEFSYSLDGNANVTISSRTMDAAGGNTTLTGLAIGNHSIVVYGKRWLYYGLYFGGTYDSFSSPTIQFNVTAQQQDSTSPSGKNPVDGTMKTQVFRIIGVIVFVAIVVPLLICSVFAFVKKRRNEVLLSS